MLELEDPDSHQTPGGDPAGPIDRSFGSASLAWILFDIGYTIFSTVIFVRYLATWFINDLDNPDWLFAAAQVVTASLLLLLLPIAGAIADASGRGALLLGAFAVGAGGGALILGAVPAEAPTSAVVVAAIAMTLFTGLAFGQFEPLLARVAPRRSWGVVSGVAVGSGLIAAMIALPLATQFATTGPDDAQRVFAPVGLLLVACTIPIVFALRHAPAETHREHTIASIRSGFARLRRAPHTARELPDAARLMLAHFLYTDAIGTVNVYMAVYIAYIGGVSERATSLVFTLGLGFAAIGGLLSARYVERIGPRRVLLIVLPICAASLALTAATGAAWTIWVVLPAAGMSLGTIYTADRVFLLRLTPPELRGELFGFFNLVGRAAQALAPLLLWGGVNALLHDATGWTSELTAARVSMLLLALTALAGWHVLRTIDDTPRTWS